jgi:hypothetical protein
MTITRSRHKMPDRIRDMLTKRKLMDAYHERPGYQKNDYIGWITSAKRLAQMLDELKRGNVYMNMKWHPK